MGLATLTTGCASVTGGTTQSVYIKTQKDSVDIVGATCVLTNTEGTYKVTTPGAVSVHRTKNDLNIQCSKEGESDTRTAAHSSARKGAVAGNLLMFGVVGVLVGSGIDAANGAAYAYPDNILVSFADIVGADNNTTKFAGLRETSARSNAANTTVSTEAPEAQKAPE